MRTLTFILIFTLTACSAPSDEAPDDPSLSRKQIAIKFAQTGDQQLLSSLDKNVIQQGGEFHWPYRFGVRSRPTDPHYGLEKHLWAMVEMSAEEVGRDGEAVTFTIKTTFPTVLDELSGAFTGKASPEKAEQLENLDRHHSQYGLAASDLEFATDEVEITVISDGVYLNLAKDEQINAIYESISGLIEKIEDLSADLQQTTQPGGSQRVFEVGDSIPGAIQQLSRAKARLLEIDPETPTFPIDLAMENAQAVLAYIDDKAGMGSDPKNFEAKQADE